MSAAEQGDVRLRPGDIVVEQAELVVGKRRRLLHAGERDHEIGVNGDRGTRDREILERPQGVHAVVGAARDRAIADQIVLVAHGIAGHADSPK